MCLLFAAACALMASSGCDSGATTKDELRSSLLRHTCELLVECPSPLLVELAVYAEGVDGCTELLERANLGAIEDLVAKVDSGAVDFDGAAYDRCWNRALATCSTGGDPSCLSAFEGKVAIGGACNTTIDCVAAAYCDNDSGNTCPGSCVARKAPGASCAGDAECDPGDGVPDCASSAAGQPRVCFQRESAVAEAGARCGSSIDGIYTTCRKGLWCNPDQPFPFGDQGICEEPLALGAQCDVFDVCAAGSLCKGNGQDTSRYCTAIRVSHKAGEACDGSTSTVCSPVDRLTCVDGACVGADGNAGAEGATCSDDLAGCSEGLTCIDGVCATPRPQDTACEQDRDCQSSSCDRASGRCLGAYCG
jgi:hypothetical protein